MKIGCKSEGVVVVYYDCCSRERICSLFGQYSCRVCRGGELRFVSGLLESALADEYGFDGPFMASSQTYSLFQSEGCCAVL